MKKFLLNAYFIFDADDLDDAFEKLEQHFKSLKDGDDTSVIQNGKCDLRPVTDEEIQSMLAKG